MDTKEQTLEWKNFSDAHKWTLTTETESCLQNRIDAIK